MTTAMTSVSSAFTTAFDGFATSIFTNALGPVMGDIVPIFGGLVAIGVILKVVRKLTA